MRFLSRVVSIVTTASTLISTSFGAGANNTSLRILPIGDSITWGYGSSDGNGYRLNLLNLLFGNSVTYLGHWHSGNMTNNNNEGYPAREISDIESYVKGNGTLAQSPNLILILAGTNDISRDHAASTAPERLGSLIDLVTTACPDAAVIVSEITPISHIWGPEQQARVEVFNAAIPGIVKMRNSSASSSKHILALKMSSYVAEDDLADALHPSDIGYQKMAIGWIDGIKQVAEMGWLNVNITDPKIKEPVGSTGKNDGSRFGDSLGGTFMSLAFLWALLVGL